MKRVLNLKENISIAAWLLLLLSEVSCSNHDRNKIAPMTTESKTSTQAKRQVGGPDPAENNGARWNADAAHAQITFSVKGPFGTVHGGFSDLRSTIKFDENDLAHSSIVTSVDPKTINTGNKVRDNDLQKETYLSSDQHPRISFRSQKFEKEGNGYRVTGTLAIKETSKTVSIPFTFNQKGNSGTFKGQFSIQRMDYDVGNTGGLLKIGKEITINLDVPVTKG